MSPLVPVAGAILPNSEVAVVEAAPESDATRAHKGIARHVYRFAQELRWAGGDRAVAIRIHGDPVTCTVVGVNLALLLSPLLDIGLECTPMVSEALGAASTEGDPPNPRDRVWLVPSDELGAAPSAERYDMTIGATQTAGSHRADLVLVLADAAVDTVELPDVDDLTDVAVVLVGPIDGELPESVARR